MIKAHEVAMLQLTGASSKSQFSPVALALSNLDELGFQSSADKPVHFSNGCGASFSFVLDSREFIFKVLLKPPSY